MPPFKRFAEDMLAAESRDVEPLLEASVEALELNPAQSEDLRLFLSQAWFIGARIALAKLSATVLKEEFDLHDFESSLWPLITDSADALNLTVQETFLMFEQLQEATVAAIRSSQTELTALIAENNPRDIAEEALAWVEERRGGD